MVKKYHFQLDAIDKQLVKLQSEQAEVEALQRQIGMTRDIEEAVKLQRQITEEEALKRQIGMTPEIDQLLGTMRTAGLAASETYRRQFNPTASEIFEQMDQKAIDDAKLRGEPPLTEIDFTPPFDFQRAESDRRDRQRERDREHDIETARLAEIARLQVRDEYEASKQAAVVAGAALDAPTPEANGTPIDESIDDRNLRWLNRYETEEHTEKRGAYNRTAAHFEVESSTLRKAVNKARDQRTARNRGGIKAVAKKRTASIFDSLGTTVKDGKKTPNNQR